MSNVYTVPKITAGQATPAKFNAPLEYIQKSLNALEAKLDGLANKSAVLQWGATVSSDTNIGDLVYFDSKNGSCFRPAIARLANKPGAQGQSVQSPSSRVEGLVVSLNPAVILKQGYYQSNIITNTIGTGAFAGVYFLSPEKAGKATLNPGWNMRQPCISYYGDGKFSMLTNYLAHDNHHHSYAKLQERIVYNSVVYKDQDPVSGTYYWNAPVSRIGQLDPQTTAIFADGLLGTGKYTCTKNKVWFTGTDPKQIADVIEVFNITPFAYGDSVVRSISTDTLNISGNSGSVQINMPDYSYAKQTSDRALSRIYNSTLYTTPIVSKIVAGAGISVSDIGNGAVTIGNADLMNYPIDATQIYMNGAQREATELLTYTIFPKGKTSSVTMSLSVNNSTEIQYNVSIWVSSKGPGTGRLNIKFYWLPFSDQNPIVIPTSPVKEDIISLQNSSPQNILYKNLDLASTIKTSGTLIAQLKAQGPVDDLRLYRMGFKLTPVATSTDSDAQINPVDSQFLDKMEKVLTYNAKY